MPAGSKNLVNIMLGTLGSMAVVSCWGGSSSGSAQKANLMEALARRGREVTSPNASDK